MHENLLNLDMITLRITAFPIPVASQIDKIFAGPTDPICLLIRSRWMSSGLFGPNFEIPFILSQNNFNNDKGGKDATWHYLLRSQKVNGKTVLVTVAS